MAQDCGTDCVACWTNSYEGRNYTPNGDHDMACFLTEWGCAECGDRAVSDAFVDARLVAETVAAALPGELAAVVVAHGRRLLVHAARGLVAVRGTKCSEDAVAVVVFVGNTKAETLRRLGVRELSGSLSTSTR